MWVVNGTHTFIWFNLNTSTQIRTSLFLSNAHMPVGWTWEKTKQVSVKYHTRNFVCFYYPFIAFKPVIDTSLGLISPSLVSVAGFTPIHWFSATILWLFIVYPIHIRCLVHSFPNLSTPTMLCKMYKLQTSKLHNVKHSSFLSLKNGTVLLYFKNEYFIIPYTGVTETIKDINICRRLNWRWADTLRGAMH